MSDQMNAVALSVFTSRLAAVCDEMGAALQRAAFSPNIKDRMDFSCAIFSAVGELVAQAAHIPVHLGSMAFAMADIVDQCAWAAGDTVVLNDPYLGGTHLPDVTMISPLFVGDTLIAFVVNRAHHANIGADTPGSMPMSSRLEQEGVVIAPTHLIRRGNWQDDVLKRIGSSVDAGDFVAQVSTNQIGCRRLSGLIGQMGVLQFAAAISALNHYAERLARAELAQIPPGRYEFCDWMDDDGFGTADIAIRLTLTVNSSGIIADFSGSHAQVEGNINCPLSVVGAAVFYVFRCLMPPSAPACAGLFRPISIKAEPGSLLNAQRPAAVAAGNVETSTRITDVVLGALAQAIPEKIPAASHGSMNNVAMGVATAGQRWDYYETIGGGMGASAAGAGVSAVQTHMTNTLNTPVESLELHYPLRLRRYQVRRSSGGDGRYRGGDGIVREFEFLGPAEATLLSERRQYQPWGLAGGSPGSAGENRLNGELLPAKCHRQLQCGDRLVIFTAGGGGWGEIAVGGSEIR